MDNDLDIEAIIFDIDIEKKLNYYTIFQESHFICRF